MVGTYCRGELLSEIQALHQTMSSHIARRTFATLMNKAGMPTKTLQEILGHSSITSTEKYSKVSSSLMVNQMRDTWKRIKS
ncbi:tyrosine-type recombinase/integrase [Spirosoma fluminis]